VSKDNSWAELGYAKLWRSAIPRGLFGLPAFPFKLMAYCILKGANKARPKLGLQVGELWFNYETCRKDMENRLTGKRPSKVTIKAGLDYLSKGGVKQRIRILQADRFKPLKIQVVDFHVYQGAMTATSTETVPVTPGTRTPSSPVLGLVSSTETVPVESEEKSGHQVRDKLPSSPVLGLGPGTETVPIQEGQDKIIQHTNLTGDTLNNIKRQEDPAWIEEQIGVINTEFYDLPDQRSPYILMPHPTQVKALYDWPEVGMEGAVVAEAIKESLKRGIRNINYVWRICQRYFNEGTFNMTQWRQREQLQVDKPKRPVREPVPMASVIEEREAPEPVDPEILLKQMEETCRKWHKPFDKETWRSRFDRQKKNNGAGGDQHASNSVDRSKPPESRGSGHGNI